MFGKHKNVVSDYTDKYVVWSPESNLTITYVYEDRPTAIKVAHDMAAKYPGQQFLVLKAVGVATTKKVEFVDLEKAKEARKAQPRVNGRFASNNVGGRSAGIKDPVGADVGLYAPGTK